MILSKHAEQILYDIMVDIENLKKYNVEVEAISINPYLVSFQEEQEIAKIIGTNIEAYRWFERKADNYILITSTVKRDKLYNPRGKRI